MNVRPSRLARIVSVLAVLGATSALAAPSPKVNSTTVADEATKDVKYDPAAVTPATALSPENATPAPNPTLPVPIVDLLPAVPVAGDKTTSAALPSEPARLENLEGNPGETESLHLSPYIVRDLPDRTYQNVNEAISQQRRLGQQRQALYKKQLNRSVRMEFVGVPIPGGVTGISANLPVLRFSW